MNHRDVMYVLRLLDLAEKVSDFTNINKFSSVILKWKEKAPLR